MAVFEMLADIQRAAYIGDMALLDLSVTFDTVDHATPISRL